MRPPAPMIPRRMVSFAPSTLVEASAVIPVAMRKLRRFSIFDTLSLAAFPFEEPERHRPGQSFVFAWEYTRPLRIFGIAVSVTLDV